MPATLRRTLKVITVRLPGHLHEQARAVVRAGATEANSLNDLLVESLTEKLRQLRRAEIDAQFAEMKHDTHHHREAQTIANEFAQSDWQTLESAEREQQ